MIRFLSLLLFAVLAVSPPVFAVNKTQQQLSREAQKAVYNAQQALEKEAHQKARDILLAHLQRHPEEKSPLVYATLGRAWYAGGNAARAFETYQEGVNRSPGSFLLCANVANLAWGLERYKEAGQYFEKAVSLADKAERDGLRYQAGAAYYKANVLKDAYRVLEPLVRKRKNPHGDWIRLLVHVALDMDRQREAERLLSRFLRDDQADDAAAYWRLLAQIRLQREDYRGAVKALEVLHGMISPVQAEWETMADLYHYLKLPLRALRTFERACGEIPTRAQCVKLSRLAGDAGLPDTAIAYLDRAIEDRPGDAAELYLEKGKIEYRRGRFEDAIPALQSAVGADPALETAWFLLGCCALETGNVDLAGLALQKAAAGEMHGDEAARLLQMIR